MGSAPRALARSHPLHVMPPRITRNSHRPRASDRSMVASEATSLACLSLQLDSIVIRAEKLTRMDNKPNLSREVKYSGLDLETEISSSGRGGAFFLTSLFIELIDTVVGVNRLFSSTDRSTAIESASRRKDVARSSSARRDAFGEQDRQTLLLSQRRCAFDRLGKFRKKPKTAQMWAVGGTEPH